jgi:small conductance mechanosensitive channel
MIDIQSFYETSKPIVFAFALKVLGAIVLYIVGRWLIGVVSSLVTRALERRR